MSKVNARDSASYIEKLSAYEKFEYATFSPSRYEYEGKYRRHKTLGHAKVSLKGSRYGLHHTKYTEEPAIYRWKDEIASWVKIYVYDLATDEFIPVV